MDRSQSPAQTEFLEKMRRQFDFGPYPRTPIEKSPNEDPNQLFVHNLSTPFYLRHRRFIDTTGTLLLDAGCGTGYKALMLATANPGAKVIGIDISPKSIELAQQRLEFHGLKDTVEFHLLAIEDVATLGMQFDYINCDEVLYFFDDIARGLGALRSVLKPEGIIRSNLHNAIQRQIYFRTQELFGLMGLMEEFSEEMAIPIVVETMKALGSWVDIKKRGWQASYENEETNTETLLANHLLQGDKGYRIADLFDGLRRADLDFVSMTNWRQWDVTDLFQEPDNLPSYMAMGLAESSAEAKLTLYELMNPVHRLLDFWCAPAQEMPEFTPIEAWDLGDWQATQVQLHPQLRTDKFKQAAVESIDKNKALVVSEFLSLPALKPVPVDTGVAALLLQLWEAPHSFTELVTFWQRIHPVDWVTLEPTTLEAAQQKVVDVLNRLEAFLYVMVERK